MTLHIKPGVVLKILQPQMAIAAQVVEGVYKDYGLLCTITSGNEGPHMPGSKHFEGYALDFRTRNAVGVKEDLAKTVRDRLGDEYDVILESDHLHVEYDPK